MPSPDKIRATVEAAVADLSEDELDAELALRREIPDLLTFIEALLIEDKETGRLVPFTLWPAQKEIVPLLSSPRLLILKARQLGLSWLELAYWLYAATFWGDRLILIARQTLDDSRDAIHRLKLMHDSAPPEWQAKITTDKATMLGFSNGSRFRTLTATKRMGRSAAAYGALLDEFAFWEWQPEQLAALEAACARLHIVTTGSGPADMTHKIWRAAEAEDGLWKRVFLPWSAHPHRTPAWYQATVVAAVEPRLARREYAATPEEAFAGPEGVYFERFERARNVADVSVVANWPTVRNIDFGYHHPACLWIQTSLEGQPFVVGELLPEDRTTEEFAREIAAREADWGLALPVAATYADPAGRSTNVQTAESEAEIFARCGMTLTTRPSSVRDGCVRIMNALADPTLPLVVSTACPWTVEALASVAPDRRHPDVYDEASPYTHVLDALRYWTVNRSSVSTIRWDPGPPQRKPWMSPYAPTWYVRGGPSRAW